MVSRKLRNWPLIALLVTGLQSEPTDAAPWIYLSGSNFTHEGLIWRTTAGSGLLETIYTVGWDDGRPMMVAEFGGQIFWTTYYPGQLWRSGLAGESPELLVDQGKDTTTRGIQFKDGAVYWSNETLGAIYRADLDGADVETVIEGFSASEGIWDFEIHGDRVYWTSWDSPSVRSIGLNGTDYRVISLEGVRRAFSIEIANDRMFVSDTGTRENNRVVSSSLNGGATTEFVWGLTELYSLDVFEGRLYFAHLEFSEHMYSRIQSIPIDGGETRDELTAPGIQLWQIHVMGEPADCNENGVPDEQDIAEGTSKDSDLNGIPDECEGQLFRRGDVDVDGVFGLGDTVMLILYSLQGGQRPSCMSAADVNSDGRVDISDAIFALNHIFRAGPEPATPGPPPGPCGRDTANPGGLSCDSYDACP